MKLPRHRSSFQFTPRIGVTMMATRSRIHIQVPRQSTPSTRKIRAGPIERERTMEARRKCQTRV